MGIGLLARFGREAKKFASKTARMSVNPDRHSGVGRITAYVPVLHRYQLLEIYSRRQSAASEVRVEQMRQLSGLERIA